MVLGGMALSSVPVQAVDVVPFPSEFFLTAGQHWSYQFSHNNPGCSSGQYQWLTMGNIPPSWVTIGLNTGLVEADPPPGSAGQSFSFVIFASEMCGGNLVYSPVYGVMLTVQSCALSIVATNIPQGQENHSYIGSLYATGGTQMYTFTASGLPAGLQMAPHTGFIVGTPPQGSAGTYNVQVTVTEAGGGCTPASVSFLINIGYAPSNSYHL
jgi:hypothetical protein